MDITIKTLEHIPIGTIHKSFEQAFADYLVDIRYMTPEVMKKRFIKNGFEPRLSRGIFSENQLVGFTVVGTGHFKGERAAFDIMTGIKKPYRGQALANEMFHHILDSMKEENITKFYLEVLQNNEPAIQAYTKTGFERTRGLECYSLRLGNFRSAKTIESVVYIDKQPSIDAQAFSNLLDWEPSWENHIESIKRIPDELVCIAAKQHGRTIGTCLYYPTLKWILLFAVEPVHRRKGIGSAMLEYLVDILPLQVRELKLMNVQDDDVSMKEFLHRSGFQRIAKQYEMVYKAG